MFFFIIISSNLKLVSAATCDCTNHMNYDCVGGNVKLCNCDIWDPGCEDWGCKYELQETCTNGCTNGICNPPACTPDCTGKKCGDNGCGGSCGSCNGVEVCEDGSCINPTTPYGAGCPDRIDDQEVRFVLEFCSENCPGGCSSSSIGYCNLNNNPYKDYVAACCYNGYLPDCFSEICIMTGGPAKSGFSCPTYPCCSAVDHCTNGHCCGSGKYWNTDGNTCCPNNWVWYNGKCRATECAGQGIIPNKGIYGDCCAPPSVPVPLKECSSGTCELCCDDAQCGLCEKCDKSGGAGTYHCVDQTSSQDLKNQCAVGSWSCASKCTRTRNSGNCDGSGSCGTNDDSENAPAGYSYDSNCDPKVNVYCNSALECVDCKGDNCYTAGYTAPADYECRGHCDGYGNCDYAGDAFGNKCTYLPNNGECNTECGENGANSPADCASPEICNDGNDNDFDGEKDWDTLGIRGPEHGDDDCAVGTGNPIVSDTTPLQDTTINIECPSTVAGVNSIQAFLDSTNIESYFTGWSGSNAVFSNVPVGSTTGTRTVRCSIDTTKSYQSGSDGTTTIDVQPSSCSGYSQAECNSAPVPGGCEWCTDCNANNQYSGGAACVPSGSCSYSCDDLQCGAECDPSTNPSCTTGDGYSGLRNCDLTDCTWEACISSESCGDSIINGPEVCDDGAAANGVECTPPYGGSCNYCSADCSQLITVTGSYCGDDILDSPPEFCDNGTDNGNTCTPGYGETCTWCDNNCNIQTETGAYCGDGTVDAPQEKCEGSNCQAGCIGFKCDPLTCQYYNASPETSCTDDKDNDCDCAIDGCDSDCQEGQGTNHRCCNDGVDNEGDTYIDEDDPGCCDLCNANPANGFDDPGAACGGIIFGEWELSTPDMDQRCCGDEPLENFRTTTIFGTPYYGCCDQSTDCVDQNGDCQNGNEELFDLCINGVDDDCDGYVDRQDGSCQGVVTGVIFNEEGFRLDGAIVTGRPAGLSEAYESQSGPSDFNGNYAINKALVGTYNFVARREGYDDDIRTVTISTAGTTYQNFTLRNGSCHADCTDYYGNCNPACEGKTFKDGTCNFINPLCNNRPKDFVVRYENITTGMMHEFTCCEGPETINPVIKATVTSPIENVYDFVSKVKYRGSFANFHMLVWEPKD